MTERKGNLAAMKTVGPQHELFIVTEGATVIRVKTDEISQTGRATQGVKMMTVDDNDRICAVARMTAAKERPEGEATENGSASEETPVDLATATTCQKISSTSKRPWLVENIRPHISAVGALRADRFFENLGTRVRPGRTAACEVDREFRTSRRALNVLSVRVRTVRAGDFTCRRLRPGRAPFKDFQKSC